MSALKTRREAVRGAVDVAAATEDVAATDDDFVAVVEGLRDSACRLLFRG